MDRHWVARADEVAPRAWAALAIVATAPFVATLDAMVLYVAFGSIRRDFPEVSAAAESEVVEVVRSHSRPDRGTVTVRSETRNQRGDVVQAATVKLLVPRRSKTDSAIRRSERGQR